MVAVGEHVEVIRGGKLPPVLSGQTEFHQASGESLTPVF